MKKQIDGQISLFDYITEEEQKAALSSVSLFKQCGNCWCSLPPTFSLQSDKILSTV